MPCWHCINPDAADGELGTRAVALLLLYPLVPESPHWLAVSGDAAGADAVLSRMAAANGAQLPPGRLEAPTGLPVSSAGVDSCMLPQCTLGDIWFALSLRNCNIHCS